VRCANQGGGERADIGVGRDAAQVLLGGEVTGDHRGRLGDERDARAGGEPEEWLSHWQRPYTRDEWLDLVPTTGGFARHPEAIQAELLDGLGAAVDAAGGTFTMSYATIAATAARLAS